MDGYGMRFLSISPKELSASKLGELIKQYEIAIRSEYKECTGSKPEDGGIVALDSIEDNCVTLRFFVAALLVTVGARVSRIPKPNQCLTERYTSASRRLYEQIYSIGSSYNTPIESFRFSQGDQSKTEVLSVISPEDISQIATARLKSIKKLYGKVVSVGGIEPKIKIQLADGETISCNATIELTQKAAGYLYESVKVTGLAKTCYSLGTSSVTEFTIHSIDRFEELSIMDLFARLKPNISDQLDRIDDLDEYFMDIREDTE
ncbi:MAG: hypothetical protein M0P37_08710 [Synergistaceae bacterium]|jgi:hypothetical protein|nr:hypothetical protein [Candidatus Cloacimonadota bacterium]MCK9341809.1 hypothetical protein [Synergistaceae bacterium]